MALQTATNPTTGERVALINGAWTPIEKTATNPQTGEQVGLIAGTWQSIRAAQQEAIPQEDREGFGAAAAASMARMEGERALVKGKSGLISEEEAMRVYNAQKAEADRLFTPTDDTFSFRNLKELAGGSLPYMAAPVAAGVAGSVLGTPVVGIGASFAASAAQFSGSNLARQIDEGKSFQEASGAKALAGAIPMAALDTFALGKIPGVRQILGRAGIEVSEDAAAAIARKGVANAAIDYTTATGKALTYEGATEAGQQFVERLQAGLNIADESARGEYFESFIGGALLGGAIAPAGRFVERRSAQQAIDAEKEVGQRAEVEDRIIAAQAEEEGLAAANEVDPETPVNDLLRERAQLLISGNDDSITTARIRALEKVIKPQVKGDIATLEEDLLGDFVQPPVDQETEADDAPTLTKAESRLERQGALDAGQIELPLRRTPAGQPTTTPIPGPVPEGTLSLQDIMDTNVPMKTSKGWFEENVVGKTLEEVQALVTADPTLIDNKGQRAKVLREILAPKPPAFEEAPRDTILAEPGPTDGPTVTEPAVLERSGDEPSLGLPDVVAPVAETTAEPAAPEQPGVVGTGLPAGDGTTPPKRSRARALKPVRAAEVPVGAELTKWRGTSSDANAPGALVGNAEVEAFLHAIDTQDAAGAQIAIDDIARVLRSLPATGKQAARRFVKYMNKQTDGGFDGPLDAAFTRIKEIPSGSGVNKDYLEPVRITKGNQVVRGSQRLLVPMNDAAAREYFSERRLGETASALDTIDEAAPTTATPQAGQQELDFTATQPEPEVLSLGETPDLTQNIPAVAQGELSPGSTSTTTVERAGKTTTTSKATPKKATPKKATPKKEEPKKEESEKSTADSVASFKRTVKDSELNRVPPGPIRRAVNMMFEAFEDTAGIDFVDKFRTLTVDAGASAERRLNVLFDGAVRSAKGIINPMGLYRQSQDSSKLLTDWFIDGALKKEELTNLYSTAKGKSSMKAVLDMVQAWGKANGLEFKDAYNELSKVLEAKRLDSLREENKSIADPTERYGINPLSKKREEEGVSANQQIDEALVFAEVHKKEVDAIQAAMDGIRFDLIDGMVSTGRLTAADGVDWKKNSNYVPFDRMQEYNDTFRTQKRTGKGISQAGKLPKFLGSDKREVANTFDNFVKTSGWMIEQTLKQDANLSTLKMLERLGQATRHKLKGTISDSKLVPAFDKGEQVYYEMPSRWDVLAFKDLSPPKGAIVNFLSSFSNVLRTTITSMPPFAVRQVVNDIQRAFATSGLEQPLKIVGPALRNFIVISKAELMGKRHPSVREFGQTGVIGDFDLNTRDPMASILYDLGYQSRGKVKGLLSRLEGITRASDLAVRKAIYDQTMIEKQDVLLATTRSREFINFRRRGASSVLPALSSTIPFFNAYLQGMDVLLRAATGKSAAAGLDKSAAKKLFYTKVTQMAAFSALYAIMSSGEDYYDEAGLQIRHNNWMLPGGIKFPVPEELGAIFKVPAEMMVEYFQRNGTNEEMKAADATFTALKYAFAQYSPVGGRMTPIPAAIKPVIEAVTNYSFFTGRELEGVYQRGQLLPSQRTRGNTTELAQAISKFTESLLGENNAISPIMIDNTLQGYFGSVAGMVTMGTDQLINPDRMDRPLQKYWMLSNFLYDPVGSRRLDEFYELRSKTFGVKGTLDKLAKEDPDAAVKFANEHINELSLAQGIGSALGQLSDTRKYKNYLNSNMAAQSMDQDERSTGMEETRRIEQELVGWLREVQADMNKAK